jgi:hypothetical protein
LCLVGQKGPVSCREAPGRGAVHQNAKFHTPGTALRGV